MHYSIKGIDDRFLEPKQENSAHTQDLSSFCKNNNINFIYSPFDVNNAKVL